LWYNPVTGERYNPVTGERYNPVTGERYDHRLPATPSDVIPDPDDAR
jgi:hypothetical protein